MLESLLMSSEMREWVSRIRYVIMDEIHCIGEENEEARAWQQLIQLMPCPFLALSATVSNPNFFHNWLCKAHMSSTVSRHDKQQPVEIIRFEERYADLSTCIYTPDVMIAPDQNQIAISNENLDPSQQHQQHSDAGSTTDSEPISSSPSSKSSVVFPGGLYALNSFICLSYEHVLVAGLTPDFYATSRDVVHVCCKNNDININFILKFRTQNIFCIYYYALLLLFLLQAVYTLRRVLLNHYTESVFAKLDSKQQQELRVFYDTMRPRDYFEGSPAITKQQFRFYLQTFKEVFVSLVKNHIVTQELFEDFQYRLGVCRPLTSVASVLDGTVWVRIIVGLLLKIAAD